MWVCDSEWDSLWPTKMWCFVAKKVNTDEEYIWDCNQPIQNLAAWIKDKQVIGHNFISYDMLHLGRVYGIHLELGNVIDTIVLSRLLNSTRTAHSIEYFGKLFGIEKPKHEDWSAYTPEMLHRCSEDVTINKRLFFFLLHEGKVKKLPKELSRREHLVAYCFRQMEVNGFPMDMQKVLTLSDKLNKVVADAEIQCALLFPDLPYPNRTIGMDAQGNVVNFAKKDGTAPLHRTGGIDTIYPFSVVDWRPTNFNSNHGIIRHLVRMHNWKFSEFTKPSTTYPKGQPKLNDVELTRLIESYPQYQPLFDLRVATDRLEKIRSWIAYCGLDGRVHSAIIPIGTATHRMVNFNPPLTQVPSSESPYGPECREAFTAPPGYKMLGTDASSIQNRILCHYLNNPEYTELVTKGDVHTYNLNTLGIDKGEWQPKVKKDGSLSNEEGTWSKRKNAKAFFYAMILGCGVAKAAEILEISYEEAKKALELFNANTPGLKAFIDKYSELAKAGYVTNFDGRWLPVEVEPREYKTGVWHGKWLGSLLQGGEQAIMRRALETWYPEALRRGIDFKLIYTNHDEWQTAVKEESAIELGELQVQSIVDAGKYFNLNAPFDGQAKVGNNWKETH